MKFQIQEDSLSRGKAGWLAQGWLVARFCRSQSASLGVDSAAEEIIARGTGGG